MGGGHSAAAGRSSFDLDHFREKLLALVQRGTVGPKPPRPHRDGAPLPFRPELGPAGTGWVHRAVMAADRRVGRVALGKALGADAALLAVLGKTPELGGCDPHKALYLDTETTGLGGAGTIPFLLGLCCYDGERRAFILEQHFVREPGGEAPLLLSLTERLARADFVVSYNGKSFDLPLLRARYVMNRLPPPPERPQLDLLHLVRRVHRSRRFRKTLISAEAHVLELDRGPDVAGWEVAQIYHHFLHTGDEGLLGSVVRHNANDVLSLVALLGLYGEPLSQLHPDDLGDVARLLKNAGQLDRAGEVVARALAQGAGVEALRVRALLAKALGDKRQALADFEALAALIDDGDVRLELAKLYEHHLREPARALAMVERGTAEDSAARCHRRARLERKLRAGRAGAADDGPAWPRNAQKKPDPQQALASERSLG